jgi:hypothetical protein
VVGEHDRGRLLVGGGAGDLDEAATCLVDRLVDPDDLVAGIPRVVCRVLGIEPVPAEMAYVIRAHEIDAQQVEVRFQLVGEATDVGDLADVVEEALRVPREVLPPALCHRMVRGDEVGLCLENAPARTLREDRRPLGATVAGDQDARDRLRRIGERDRDERRAHSGNAERAPERRPGAADGVLDTGLRAVRVAGEV